MNDYYALQLKNKLIHLPLSQCTKYVESVSSSGKWVGSGKGMQYFDSILIKSDLSINEWEVYYSKLRTNQWEYLVEVQRTKKIEIVEHESLYFKKRDDEVHYIVYSWGKCHSFFLEWDIRGY